MSTGIFGFLNGLFLQILGKYFNYRALQTGNQVLQINELLEEENEVHFEGLFSAKT